MYVYDDKVVFEGNRGWIKKREEVIGYRQIAEVVHSKGIFQSTITIVNTGGVASIILGHLAPGLAEKAKDLIDEMVRQSWASNFTQSTPSRGGRTTEETSSRQTVAASPPMPPAHEHLSTKDLSLTERLAVKNASLKEGLCRKYSTELIESRAHLQRVLTTADTSASVGDSERERLIETKRMAEAAKHLLKFSHSVLSDYEGRYAELFEVREEHLEERRNDLRRNLIELAPLVEKYSDLVEIQEQICLVAAEGEGLTRQWDDLAARLAREKADAEEIQKEIEAATEEKKKEKLQKKYAERAAKMANYSAEISAATSNLEQLPSRFEGLCSERRSVHETAQALLFTLPGSHSGDTTSRSTVPSDGQDTGEIDDVFSQIQKLAELHKSGILTDEEFESKKSDLLSRI